MCRRKTKHGWVKKITGAVMGAVEQGRAAVRLAVDIIVTAVCLAVSFVYEVDFTEMEQRNTSSGKVRPIQRDDSAVMPLCELQATIETLQKNLNLATGSSAQLMASVMQAQSTGARAQEEVVRLQAELIQTREATALIKQSVLLEKSMGARARDEVARLQAELTQACEATEKVQQSLRQDVERLQTDLDRTRQETQEARLLSTKKDQEFAKALQENDICLTASLAQQRHAQLKDLELWRTSEVLTFVDDHVLKEVVKRLLYELSHQDATYNGAPSRCTEFKDVTVQQVRRIINPAVWTKYRARKEDMKKELSKRRITPVSVGSAHQGFFSDMVPGLALENDLNEVLLIHACPADVAENIARAGFDIRFSGTGGGAMYGKGIYFTHQACKANQYTTLRGQPQASTRTLFISRVALGDFHKMMQPYSGVVPMGRNPGNPDHGYYHSHAIDPQVCHHSQGKQAHWEYVIFDGTQAYPEFLVEYTIP